MVSLLFWPAISRVPYFLLGKLTYAYYNFRVGTVLLSTCQVSLEGRLRS